MIGDRAHFTQLDNALSAPSASAVGHRMATRDGRPLHRLEPDHRGGVKLVLDPKPGTGFYSEHVDVGDFDMVQFDWAGTAFPLAALPQVFASDGDGNFGKIGNSTIDAKIDETLSELDPDKARALANQVDTMIWQEGFSVPLYQSPGNVAVRSNLANYGAFGLADVYYPVIGFTRS